MKKRNSPELQYRYDEQQGTFIRESDISINWLLNQVLGTEGLKITKVSNDEIYTFLGVLDKTNLRMISGQHSLFWLKNNIEEKRMMADAKTGEVWHNIADRYRFIIEQIDLILVNCNDIKEKMKTIDEIKTVQKDPNDMILKFKKDVI